MDQIKKIQFPSGRDIRKQSLPGDVFFDPEQKELWIIHRLDEKKIGFCVYETISFKMLREESVSIGKDWFERIQPLVPVHVTCELFIKSYMIGRLSARMDELLSQIRGMEGFLSHIAGLLSMNGSDPQEMRARIERLVAKANGK